MTDENMKNACSRPKQFDGVHPDTVAQIEKMISENKVFLFMKGHPDAPMCRFSATATQILKNYGAEFGSFDILRDQEMRYAVKMFSNWPTYPQLYVNGKLIGGCDIILEMDQDGELEAALK